MSRTRPLRPGSPGPSGARRASPTQEYDLRLRYYCTMKPRRVYPLVVEVSRRAGAVPADGPTGVQVTLRPIVPGALVAPAELPLDVSRPGSRATFHVTPLALGRLPEARVQVFHEGRPIQDLSTQMKGKRQLLTWVLLLLTLLMPLALVHWTRTAPLRGLVGDRRLKPELGQKKPPVPNKPAPEVGNKPPPPGRGAGAMGPPPPVPDDGYEYYQRPGTPGEVLTIETRGYLLNNVPQFPGSKRAFGDIANALGSVYGYLWAANSDLYPGFCLGVLLFILTLGSWALHRPTRVRRRAALVLAGVATGPTVRAVDNAETLPLSAARDLE